MPYTCLEDMFGHSSSPMATIAIHTKKFFSAMTFYEGQITLEAVHDFAKQISAKYPDGMVFLYHKPLGSEVTMSYPYKNGEDYRAPKSE